MRQNSHFGNTAIPSTLQSNQLFHDGGRYHIETSPLICFANHWTGFYMITASVMKESKMKLNTEYQRCCESLTNQ